MADTLDPTTPVPAQTLRELEALDLARSQLGMKLLGLEQEKITLMIAADKIEAQRANWFKRILSERGLAPTTEIEIDSKTGELSVIA